VDKTVDKSNNTKIERRPKSDRHLLKVTPFSRLNTKYSERKIWEQFRADQIMVEILSCIIGNQNNFINIATLSEGTILQIQTDATSVTGMRKGLTK